MLRFRAAPPKHPPLIEPSVPHPTPRTRGRFTQLLGFIKCSFQCFLDDLFVVVVVCFFFLFFSFFILFRCLRQIGVW